MVTDPASVSRLNVELADGRCVAKLHRPTAGNAVDQKMTHELHELCAELEAHPRILIISGSGSVFAAGADLHELMARGPDDALTGINRSVFDRIARLPLPTIAAVNGVAIGGGAELAYACDFRIGSTAARFVNPEPQLGMLPASGACYRLRELVGLARATSMLLAGEAVDAEAALACGLLNSVVEPAGLIPAAHALAQRIERASSAALRLTKLALHAERAAHPQVDDLAQALLFSQPERAERISHQLSRLSKAKSPAVDSNGEPRIRP
jgi:enoyl-CoA hydratase